MSAKIRCYDSQRLLTVSILTDQIVLFTLLFHTLTANVPKSLIVGPIVLFVMYVTTELFSRVRLYRMGARTFLSSDAPAMARILEEESNRINGGRLPVSRSQVYIVPRGDRATAFILGGFRSKLVVTGRLCVAADVDPSKTSVIVRHEFAHAVNRDSLIWVLLVPTLLLLLAFSIALIPPLFGEQLGQPTSDQQLTLVGLGSDFLSLILVVVLAKRREYFADAVALNSTPDRATYDSVLRYKHVSGLFHPTIEERSDALVSDSPILRANVVILTVIAMLSFPAIARLVKEIASIKAEGFEYRYLDLNLLLVVGLVAEFRKGFRKKIPLALGESSAYLQRNARSPLARLCGLADDRIDWKALVLFVVALSLGISIFRLLKWKFDGLSIDLPELFIGLAVMFAVTLAMSWGALLLLRRTRSVGECAVTAGLGYLLIMVIFNAFKGNTLVDFRWFATFVSASILWWVLGWAAARGTARELFLGLTFALLAASKLDQIMQGTFRFPFDPWSEWNPFGSMAALQRFARDEFSAGIAGLVFAGIVYLFLFRRTRLHM